MFYKQRFWQGLEILEILIAFTEIAKQQEIPKKGDAAYILHNYILRVNFI